MKITRAEIELSSYCNAACPGCKRTTLLLNNKSFPLRHLDEGLLFDRFSKIDDKDFYIKLCGVLGDPLLHPKILNIIKWFLNRSCKMEISTNASLKSEKFWSEIGRLSAETKNLNIKFAVDGLEDTNAIYRVNTDFQKILRNMKTYSKEKGLGTWVFIEFDHNLHQKEKAREMAQSLNFEFYVRRATRNIQGWKVPKQLLKNQPAVNEYQITMSRSQQHSKIDSFKKYLNNQMDYKPQSIDCKFVHGKEFFLACDGTVWPCCYLWDEYISQKTDFYKRVDEEFPHDGWNSIYKNDLEAIFLSDFYSSLSDLWDDRNPRFTKRCYQSCAEKGFLRNSFSKN